MSFGLTYDLSGFLGLPQSLKVSYVADWNTYNRIQTLNSNVSTARGGGAVPTGTPAVYYQYVTYAEKTSFLNGQMLHIRRYPDSNWSKVSEN